ncbi:MAG: hypothetical protein K0R10_364 [Alphaproteobacteria bacterium]|jgi:hypothetical protein|nr:hypothetical protein [Alphaproteobacteria bacterium]
MSDLSTQLQQACAHFGLRLELGFTVPLENGMKIHALARLPDLGGPNGMLIFTNYEEVSQLREDLSTYAFSIMSNRDSDFDAESWREVFIDWKWSGDPEQKPKWMTEPPLADFVNVLSQQGDDNVKDDALRKIAAIHWDDDKAEQILFDFACARKVQQDLLYSTAIESIADLWIHRGEINKEMYQKLNDQDLTQILSHWFKEFE